MERALSEYVEDNAPNRWISVDEGLPEVGDSDWCGHWLNLDSAVHYAQNVIVWMPYLYTITKKIQQINYTYLEKCYFGCIFTKRRKHI